MNLGIPLSLKGAEYQYPESVKKSLCCVDLEIRAGEWVAVLGPNGSGKSTLLKLFNALLVPTQGLCLVDGQNTKENGAAENVHTKVAIVFQNPEDQIVASVVEEDTAFGPENLGMPSEVTQERVKDALCMTGLWEKRKSAVSALSGGQKQRLALAGVLAIKPNCLLLDEAMSMLDPSSRRDFLKLIRAEHETGITVVQVTHNLDEISYADRVILLNEGIITWRGGAQEFLAQSSAALSKINFEKPSISILRDELVNRGIIPETAKADVMSIKRELCR
jgi:energy-coupling factor transport system ATP-binding protein